VRGGLLPMEVGTGLSNYTAGSRWQGPGGICKRASVGHAADRVLSALLFLHELVGGARQTRRREDRGSIVLSRGGCSPGHQWVHISEFLGGQVRKQQASKSLTSEHRAVTSTGRWRRPRQQAPCRSDPVAPRRQSLLALPSAGQQAMGRKAKSRHTRTQAAGSSARRGARVRGLQVTRGRRATGGTGGG
jgi:hypothetical protein